MATEVELIVRFRGPAPEAEDIEQALDCDVLEYVPTEVE
jgi:hypothetical protein